MQISTSTPPQLTSAPQLFLPTDSTPAKPGRRHNLVERVLWARFSTSSPLKSIKASGSNSPSQKMGKRYEARIVKRLTALSVGTWHAHPWLEFADETRPQRFCQPDLLLFRDSKLFIFEIKLSHTIDAYWQLCHLYNKVLFSATDIHHQFKIEITRSFDPDYRWPVPVMLFFSFEHLLRHLDSAEADLNTVYILQLKDKP